MPEPVKPVNSRTNTSKVQPKPQKTDKVRIGNVEFRSDEIIADQTLTYSLNGKKMNTVFVKPGVRIDFPDQDPRQKAKVESIGLRSEWYNPDDSNIHIDNIENATIFGIPNKTDCINLSGTSKHNKVIVNQKESWYINRSQRRDHVDLDGYTNNNTVIMDEDDTTTIYYNRKNDDGWGSLDVKGEGISEQEPQLKASKIDYNVHKLEQNKFYKFLNE